MSQLRSLLPLVLLVGWASPLEAQTRVHNRNAYDVWVATGLVKEGAFPMGPKGPANALESSGWLRIPADSSAQVEATHLLAITRRLDGSIVVINQKPRSKDSPRVFYFKDHPQAFHRTFGDGPGLVAQIKSIGGQPREYLPLSWFLNPRTGDHEISGPDLPAITERYAIGLFNATDNPQLIRFRWDPTEEWTRFTLASGSSRVLDNSEAGHPEIEYDFSPAPGFQLRKKRLEADAVLVPAGKEPRWRDAQRYVFFPRGGESVLLAYSPIEFPPVGKGPGEGLDGLFVNLEPREDRTYKIEFPKDRKARVSIRGPGVTDVDLLIFSGKTEIKRDDRPGDACECTWTPKATEVFLVKVQNLDFSKSTRVRLEHNGTLQPGGPSIAFLPGKDDKKGSKTPAVTINFKQTCNVLPFRDFSLNINLKTDKEVVISAAGQGTTRVDMVIFTPDGRMIAAENTGPDQCEVTFTPPVAGQYRIRLHNHGKLLNQVTVVAK